MRPSFNLIEKPWITCLLIDGQSQDFGIKAVLTNAAAMREVCASSPLITTALHRLLLAILHGAFGPENAQAWIALWERGAFDAGAIEEYLERQRDRFDLFDDRFPFYQTPGLSTKEPWPASRLAQELAAKTDPTLFDHTVDAHVEPMPSVVAARYLVAMQAFTLGGLVTYEDKAHKSAKAAPLANAAVVLLRGRNLFETLMLNLHRYSPTHGEPFRVLEHDRPAWERDEATTPAARAPDGYLDWLTWQSRSIRLIHDGGGDRVRQVVVMKGYQLPNDVWRRQFETMVPFQAQRQAAAGEDPWPAFRFNPDRSLWRDSHALFQTPSVDSIGTSPKTVTWLAELREAGARLPAELMVDVLGLASKRKSPVLWRHERFEFSTGYLGDRRLVSDLGSALTMAERAARLFDAGWFDESSLTCQRPRPMQLLADALVPPKVTGNRKFKKAEIEQAKKAAKPILEPIGLRRRYWAALDPEFRRLFEYLPKDILPDEHGIPRYGRQRSLHAWAAAVETSAERAFREGTTTIGTTARGLRAVAMAEGEFERLLNARIKTAKQAWGLIEPSAPEGGA